MTEHERSPAGTISGFDISVPDAAGLRDCSTAAIGWTAAPFDMDG